MRRTICGLVLAMTLAVGGLGLGLGLGLAGAARAEVVTKEVAYRDGDVSLKGLLAWDDAMSGKRPGVL